MTLYERLGGQQAISVVVDKFYQLMIKDERVSNYYKQVDLNKLRIRQKQFITLVTGGPNKYEGADMKTSHCKLSIGHFEFDATWQNLETALKFFNAPSKQIHELKQIFYSVESDIVNKPESSHDSQKSLYEKLGGHDAVNLVVNKFYDIMLKDTRVSYYFANTNMEKQRTSQVEFISMATGGPNNYKGQDMKAAHCPYKISHLEFDATWQNLQTALKAFSVPKNLAQDLKEVFYSVEGDIVNETQKIAQKPKVSACPFSKEQESRKQESKILYQRLGGKDALDLVVNKFYDIMLKDSRVSYYFANTNMQKQRNSQVEFISMATGGPNNYKGKDMKTAHCPYKINHLEFNATWQNLQTSLKSFSVPSNLIAQLKEVFYSVEGQIVHEAEQRQVEKKCPASTQHQPKSDTKSLYERLGGHGAIYLVVHKFYDFMLEDKRVNYYFANTNMQKQRSSQIDFITLVTGGPNNYRGKDMKTAHCPYKISHLEYDATWDNLEKAFQYFKVNTGLVQEVKEIFYSVEEDIVYSGQNTEVALKPVQKDEIRQVTSEVQGFTITSQGLTPVTFNPHPSPKKSSSPSQRDSPQKYEEFLMMKCPHMTQKLKQTGTIEHKLSQNQKRKLKQEVISKEIENKEVRKLNNCPYQKTYY